MTLKKWRKQQGLTQIDAAKLIGITQGFLSEIENKGTASLSSAIKVRNATKGKVTVDDLVRVPA